MSKIAKTFRLRADEHAYIEKIAEENQIDRTKALELIIAEHKAQSDFISSTETFAAAVVNEIEKKYKNTFTRIRLAATGADQNALILLEMINTILIALNIDQHAYTSRISKSDVWKDCEADVKHRIEGYKQRKDSQKK